jgi:hypothetical protein
MFGVGLCIWRKRKRKFQGPKVNTKSLSFFCSNNMYAVHVGPLLELHLICCDSEMKAEGSNFLKILILVCFLTLDGLNTWNT